MKRVEVLTAAESDLLTEHGCTAEEIERVADGIFALEWAAENGAMHYENSEREFENGTSYALSCGKLHRSSRFKHATKMRVNQCLSDLEAKEIVRNVEVAEPKHRGRPPMLALVDSDYVPLSAEKREYILLGYLALFRKAARQSIHDVFNEDEVKKILSDKRPSKIEFLADCVAMARSPITSCGNPIHFKKGQIFENDKEFAAWIISQNLPVLVDDEQLDLEHVLCPKCAAKIKISPILDDKTYLRPTREFRLAYRHGTILHGKPTLVISDQDQIAWLRLNAPAEYLESVIPGKDFFDCACGCQFSGQTVLGHFLPKTKTLGSSQRQSFSDPFVSQRGNQ